MNNIKFAVHYHLFKINEVLIMSMLCYLISLFGISSNRYSYLNIILISIIFFDIIMLLFHRRIKVELILFFQV